MLKIHNRGFLQNAGEMVAKETDSVLCNDYFILIPPSLQECTLTAVSDK